jgi:ribonuclease HII
MAVICGIDEAGRGPVVGPLVIVAVTIDADDEKKLVKLGVKDSKDLTPKQRESMYDKIIDIVKDHKIEMLLPSVIDTALETDGTNLNWLEADTSINLIAALKPDKALLDCPSNNTKAYSDYINERLKVPCEIIAEHKADEKYPVVSAASIIAKVTRDAEIAKIQSFVDGDLGSGYPADPVTRKFLEENYDKYPEIFRKTWASYKDVVRMKGQRKLGEF